jgi:hypothetical protein
MLSTTFHTPSVSDGPLRNNNPNPSVASKPPPRFVEGVAQEAQEVTTVTSRIPPSMGLSGTGRQIKCGGDDQAYRKGGESGNPLQGSSGSLAPWLVWANGFAHSIIPHGHDMNDRLGARQVVLMNNK